jgi:FixJ family two-component response regulator
VPVRLPRVNLAQNPSERTPRVIAVVDDDASLRTAVDGLLRSRGYLVCTFPSAEALLESPHLANLSCVITDVRMPAMDGVQLQNMLRVQGRAVSFIFITAFPEVHVRTLAMNGGAVCFLEKPFDAPTLLQCVERALRA